MNVVLPMAVLLKLKGILLFCDFMHDAALMILAFILNRVNIINIE